MDPDFQKELEQLINRYSEENGSNTPDFVLASYISSCLKNWNDHVLWRDRWYGVHLVPGASKFIDTEEI